MNENQENGFTEAHDDSMKNSQGTYSNNTGQNNPYQPSQLQYNAAEPIPNGVAALVLGICSVVFAGVCVFLGLICGIIGLVLGNRGLHLYRENPNRYRGYGTLNAGRILSIIGIVFSALMVVFWIFFSVLFVGILSTGALGSLLYCFPW